MSSISQIVQQYQQMPLDLDKLRALCARKNAWDYFRIGQERFFNSLRGETTSADWKILFRKLVTTGVFWHLARKEQKVIIFYLNDLLLSRNYFSSDLKSFN